MSRSALVFLCDRAAGIRNNVGDDWLDRPDSEQRTRCEAGSNAADLRFSAGRQIGVCDLGPVCHSNNQEKNNTLSECKDVVGGCLVFCDFGLA